VLAGQVAGREHDQQVTVFDSVGFALEDYSALRLVHRLAQQHSLGRPIDLVPQCDDPKDLFSHALGHTGRVPLRRVA
jgi:ornithine cyclodeaminase